MTSSMEPPENCGVTRKTPVVMKFGGSSLADAEMLVRVCNIVKQKIEVFKFERNCIHSQSLLCKALALLNFFFYQYII